MFFGKLKPTKGVVHINKDWCKGCAFCVEYCPTDVLEMAPEYNKKGYHPPVVVDAEACTNCRFCEVVCPEFSIFVTPMEEEEQSA